jgi:hypothetical protein
MPRVGFEPTIPVFERAKTVRTLDGGATVIGTEIYTNKIKEFIVKNKLDMRKIRM